MECKHCHRETKSAKRGLCVRCYDKKDIRSQYPLNRYEPTQEEVDKMIEEQMENLPKWWHKEKG